MGQAKPFDLRQQVIVLKQQGLSHAQIAVALQIGLGTVKNLWKRYSIQGESGLVPLFNRCGRRIEANHATVFRLVRLIKHKHPSWGVPLILVKISEKFPQVTLQSVRHYQRQLMNHSGQLPPPILPPPIQLDRSRIAHDVWQIDAKERFSMLNGKEVCYLTICDESTGALIAARAFPPWAYRPSPFRVNPNFYARTIPALDDAQEY